MRALTWAWHRAGWPPIERLAGPCDVVHSPTPLLVPADARRAGRHRLRSALPARARRRSSGPAHRDFAALVRDHVRRADHVIAGSAYAAGLVTGELGVPRRPGHDDAARARPPGPPRCARPAAPRRARRFLFLGTLEPRKNLGVLLDAYARLRRASGPTRRRSCWPAGPPPPPRAWLARLETPPLAGTGAVARLRRRRRRAAAVSRARACWSCRRSTKASACRRSRRWRAACRWWRPPPGRCRRWSATPAPWSIRAMPPRWARRAGGAASTTTARRRPGRAAVRPAAAAFTWAATAAGDPRRAYDAAVARAAGAAADAGRDRRARARRPADRRRPLPGRAAARVARAGRAPAATSWCSTATGRRPLPTSGWPVAGRAGLGRHALGAVGVRARPRPRSPRRAVRARLHRAAGLPGAGGAGRSRRLLLRPSGVVHRPRGPAAAADHGLGGAPGPRRAGAVGVLGPRDRALHRRARVARARRPPRRARGRRRRRAPRAPDGAVRRLALPAPAPRRAHRRVRARGRRASRRAPRHRRREPHRAARRLRGAGGGARPGRARQRAPLGGRRDAGHALCAGASAFAFLSEYEGFGFTPLEALAHGAVPVVLDTPVAREIYGEAAIRVADGPALVDDLAAALGAAARRPGGAGAVPRARRRRCWPATGGPTPRPAPGAPSRRRPVPEPVARRSSSSATTSAPISSACLQSLAAHPPARADDHRRRRQRLERRHARRGAP